MNNSSDVPKNEAPSLSGATPEEWAHWQRLGLGPFLLPVVCDLTAPISPSSKLSSIDGKTPSRFDRTGGVTGFPGWTAHRSTPAQIKLWSADRRIGIGIQTQVVRAIDIDIDDAAAAQAVIDLINLTAGELPRRTRAGVGRAVLMFKLDGVLPKRVIKTAHGAIEFLANGQHFVAAGRHKSGARYQWEGGLPAVILDMSLDEFEVLWAGLRDLFALPGGASTGRAPIALQRPRSAADAADPAVPWLYDRWIVLDERDGALVVQCPNEGQHTTSGDPTASVYYPIGVGARGEPGFKCMHAHCEHLTGPGFLRAVGYDDPADDFATVTLTADEERASDEARVRNQPAGGRVALHDFYAHGPSHKAIHAPTGELWPLASVDGMVKPWPKSHTGKALAPSKYLDQYRAVHQMTWAPGEPTIIDGRLMTANGWQDHAGSRVFNKYVAPREIPGDASKAGPWLDHLSRLYPDESPHIVAWCAHRVQRPYEKVNHALVLGGGPGVGKDTVLVPVRAGVGHGNATDISPGHIFAAFNSWAASVLLVISEARDLGENDRFKFYEASKALLASPPDAIRINEKFVPEYNVPNLVGVVITTNHRTSGLYLPADDRRHFVAWSEASREQFDEGYWRTLYGWYAEGGVGHVVAYLRAFDLSSFDAKAPPRKTPAFWAMVAAGEAPESSELRDVLERLGHPDAVTVAQIAALASHQFRIELEDRKGRARIPHMLDRVGYVNVRNPHAADGRFGKHVVYGPSTLRIAERIGAARALCERLQVGRASDGATAPEIA